MKRSLLQSMLPDATLAESLREGNTVQISVGWSLPSAQTRNGDPKGAPFLGIQDCVAWQLTALALTVPILILMTILILPTSTPALPVAVTLALSLTLTIALFRALALALTSSVTLPLIHTAALATTTLHTLTTTFATTSSRAGSRRNTGKYHQS